MDLKKLTAEELLTHCPELVYGSRWEQEIRRRLARPEKCEAALKDAMTLLVEYLSRFPQSELTETAQHALRGYRAIVPDSDYSCGAAYCDDPACITHNIRAANKSTDDLEE